MGSRYTYEGCLCWGGDIQTGEVDIVATYAVERGYPATREDPGEGDAVVDIEVVSVNGTPWADYQGWTGLGLTKADALDELVEKLTDQRFDEMIEQADEDDEPDWDAIREDREETARYWAEQDRDLGDD